jgi:hypothetical protein
MCTGRISKKIPEKLISIYMCLPQGDVCVLAEFPKKYLKN